MSPIGMLRHSPRRTIFGRSWGNRRQTPSEKPNKYTAFDPSWTSGLVVLKVGEAVVMIFGLYLDRIVPTASLSISLTFFFAVLWLG